MRPAMPISPPSGCQHVLVHKSQQAVVVEVGGGLRSYVVDGRQLLDGFDEQERATAARGQPLIPWPNRLRDGRYAWDGEQHQVALSEPERSNAIHGLLRWVDWTAARQTTASVVMSCRLPPQSGYPFTLDVSIEYLLTDDGLEVTTTARNAGAVALPYAAGQHPYLLAADGVDGCMLTLNAATYLETDDRGLPLTWEPVAGSDYDFRTPRQIADTQLDHAFTDLARDERGRAWVRVGSPDGSVVGVWTDESYRYIELFTGDALPDPARRRRSLGVEPMTGPPNALGDGREVTRLEPGDSTTSRWGLQAMPS